MQDIVLTDQPGKQPEPDAKQRALPILPQLSLKQYCILLVFVRVTAFNFSYREQALCCVVLYCIALYCIALYLSCVMQCLFEFIVYFFLRHQHICNAVF